MSVDFFYRLIGMVVFAAGGVYLGNTVAPGVGQDPGLWSQIGGWAGALVGLILTPWLTIRPIRSIRALLGQLSARTLMAGIFGLIVSLVIGGLLAFPLSLLPPPYSQVLPIAVALLVSYFGVTVFITRQNDIFSYFGSLTNRGGGELRTSDKDNGGRVVLIDTSVIIDGRITDISRTGFLSGTLLIPRFVLNELQHVADSGDALRRQRGRRGLEVLSSLQKDSKIPVKISDIDVEGAREVDDKLVILARQLNAPVLTNDFNLNRVAELQGVQILNINELANAVRAVFLPGEELTVRVIQEGREAKQGVGYLEDGTMVVVQDGDQHIGEEVPTSVTKVLQTAAGRMIFAKPEKKTKGRKRGRK